MRRKEKEIIEDEILNEIICGAKVCRLGLSDEGVPYIVPLCFGYKEKTLFFHSATEGNKIEIIKKNPSVCFDSRSRFAHLPNNMMSQVAGFTFFGWLSGADSAPLPLLLAELAEA